MKLTELGEDVLFLLQVLGGVAFLAVMFFSVIVAVGL